MAGSITELKSPQKETTIQDLDAHCLSHILSRVDGELPHDSWQFDYECRMENLRACSLVSRDWLDATNFARSSLTLRGTAHAALLPRFAARFSNIMSVDLVDLGGKSAENEQLPGAFCGSKASEGLFEFVMTAFSKLLRLTLVCCDALSDTALVALLKGCRNLETLNVDECRNVSGEGAKAVGTMRLRLQPPLAQLRWANKRRTHSTGGYLPFVEGCLHMDGLSGNRLRFVLGA